MSTLPPTTMDASPSSTSEQEIDQKSAARNSRPPSASGVPPVALSDGNGSNQTAATNTLEGVHCESPQEDIRRPSSATTGAPRTSRPASAEKSEVRSITQQQAAPTMNSRPPSAAALINELPTDVPSTISSSGSRPPSARLSADSVLPGSRPPSAKASIETPITNDAPKPTTASNSRPSSARPASTKPDAESSDRPTVNSRPASAHPSVDTTLPGSRPSSAKPNVESPANNDAPTFATATNSRPASAKVEAENVDRPSANSRPPSASHRPNDPDANHASTEPSGTAQLFHSEDPKTVPPVIGRPGSALNKSTSSPPSTTGDSSENAAPSEQELVVTIRFS